MQPLDPADWLQRDETFADQMALRDRLIAGRRELVTARRDGSEAAIREMAAQVATSLATDPGYTASHDGIRRPDGVVVDEPDPLIRSGRLVQEDLLLLVPRDGRWVLEAGVLCFPSHWTLGQKIGRDLGRIHVPVPFYSGELERRVQRLFDALRPGRPLWRANWLLYPDADLHNPLLEFEEKRADWSGGLYLRVERQSLLKLPETGGVVFSIKTDIAPVGAVPREALVDLLTAFDALGPVERGYKGGDDARARIVAAIDRAA